VDFVAIDVETANADMASICQIGIAHIIDGAIAQEWVTYVDPEDYFDWINVSIHGIDEERVKGAPTLPAIADQLHRFLDNRVGVCHTHFDRIAVLQSFSKYGLRSPSCTWLDSARVARRTWQQFASRGYGLASVCSFLGYEFAHHDALADAKAAAHVLMAAIENTGMGVQGWLQRVEQPCGEVARDGNPGGALNGEILVFTGSLELPRWQAAEMAAKVGCTVGEGVTKKTTILVVGDQDISKLAWNDKSSKHRKAEQLIHDGQAIRILRESDFKELVSCLG
jgi:DNA polymerase III subunit epsilon